MLGTEADRSRKENQARIRAFLLGIEAGTSGSKPGISQRESRGNTHGLSAPQQPGNPSVIATVLRAETLRRPSGWSHR